MKLDDVDRMTKTKLMSYLATSCKLAENSHGQSFNGVQSRVAKPINCSIAPLSPCQSPPLSIPSPTVSSPLEAHSPSAFSPPMPVLSRSPTEKTPPFPKPMKLQNSSHLTQNSLVLPKFALTQKDFESRLRSTAPIKPKLWRPW